jgi:two-component system nitrate/nitrite response regulator NarL
MQMTSDTEGVLVAVVHSSSLLRAGLTSLLPRIKNLEIMDAASLEELTKRILNRRVPDTVLLSIDDFDTQIEALSDFRDDYPDVKIITLARDYEAEHLFALFDLGVAGALLDDVSQNAIELAFRLISEGEKIYPSNLATVLMERFQYMSSIDMNGPAILETDLSQREREILKCLASGDSNKRIAIRLNISEATVKVHVKSILRKIKVDNRTQAAIWALRHRSYANRAITPPFTSRL